MQIPPLAPGARQGALVRLLEAFDAIFVWSKEGGIHFWSKGLFLMNCLRPVSRALGHRSGSPEDRFFPARLFKIYPE
jgi:hypothetical protein